MCVRSQQSEEVSSRYSIEKKPKGFGPPPRELRVSPKNAVSIPPVSNSRLVQLITLLRGTTQPSHFIVVVSILALSVIFSPSRTGVLHGSKLKQMLMLLHLTAFAIQFGSQVWMTFVSGLSLYFTMPKHTFGEIQRVLFPLYFTLTCILSLITLYTYSQLYSIEDDQGQTQAIIMCFCFMVQLLTRLYLCPPLIRFMETKHKIEKMASSTAIAKCPHYIRHCRFFRRAHAATAICNIISMACTTFHLHHLSQQFCI